MLLVDGPRSTLRTMTGRATAPLVPVGFPARKENLTEPSPANPLSLTEHPKNIPAPSLLAVSYTQPTLPTNLRVLDLARAVTSQQFQLQAAAQHHLAVGLHMTCF